jgi:hypothetical protein
MKLTYKNSLIAALLLCGATACHDKLDPIPQDDLLEGEALATQQNVLTTLRGGYNEISQGAYFGGNILLHSELLAADGNLVFSGTYDAPNEIFLKDITTINADATDLWGSAYATINISNNVLSALDVLNEDIRDQVEAEARFLRGLSYFELVRYYALPYNAPEAPSSAGVPLVTQPTRGIDESSYPSRNTVQEVYNFAEADLQFAEANLPNDNGVFATKAAAAGILSRLYLQQQDYAAARDAANRGIEYALDNGKNLLGEYASIFNNTEPTSEVIFTIDVNNQDGTNNMQLYFASDALNGRGDVEIEDKFFQLFDDADIRADFVYDTSPFIRSSKWMSQFADVIVLRLAELYLTRGEANTALGTTVGATPAEDINRTRTRAGLDPLTDPTVEDFQLERQREFAFEGQKVHDYKRWELTIEGLAYDAPELVFPIPQREREVNPNLTQNLGY